MNIYLIGYRCSGKTTVGKSLAEILGWLFVDLDIEFVRQNRKTVFEFVAQYGWDIFREKEHEMLQRICSKATHVVATGGGVVADPRNSKIMRDSGTVVWLQASVSTIKQRILEDHNTDTLRPALTPKGSVDEIEELLQERTPLYARTADLSVATDQHDVIEISRGIAKKLEIAHGLVALKPLK